MDLRSLSDDDLNEHRIAVATECERRANLAAIPEQIAAMAVTFRDGGGDPEALTAAISDPPPVQFDGGFDLYEVDEETITH